MRVVITRPRDQAAALARELAAAGIDGLIEPLLDIVPRAATMATDGVQAFLVTSANGARALAAATDVRDIPLLAVGDRTAQVARDLGFDQVDSAGGAVDDLAALAIARLDPAAGRVVHAAGADSAGDLAGTLGAAGFRIDRAVLYDAVAAAELSPGVIAAIDGQTIDAVLFFSPRTAGIFAKLAAGRDVGAITAFCLSPAVAAALGDMTWRDVVVSDRPTRAALLAAVLARHRAGSTNTDDMSSSDE